MPVAGSFAEFVGRADSHKIYLSDMRILRKSTTGTPETYPLYVATEAYFPPPGSVVDYHEALLGIPRYQRSAQEVFSGRSFPSFGEVVIANNAGTLDTHFSRGWTRDQPIQFRLGGPSDEIAYGNFGTVLTGIMGMQKGITDTTITIPVFDDQRRLEMQVPTTFHTATEWNATLGTPSFPNASEGVPKAIIYGEVLNYRPTLVDQAFYTYSVAGHPLTQIGTVYDNGIDITPNAVIDLNQGTFRLTARPFGIVTCDVKGRKTHAGTYTDRLGGVIEAFLIQEMGYASSGIDQVQLAALKTQRDVRVGIAISQVKPGLEIIDQLIEGLLIFYGHNRSGSIDFHVLAKPSASITPKLIFRDDIELLDDFSWSWSEPKRGVQLGYGNNETVMQESQTIAGSVTPERREWLVREQRFYTATNGTVSAFYPYSQSEDPITTRLIDYADAQRIGNERLSLVGEERRIIEAAFGVQPMQIDMGDIIQIERQRYDICGRWAVIGIEEDYIENSVRLTVFQ